MMPLEPALSLVSDSEDGVPASMKGGGGGGGSITPEPQHQHKGGMPMPSFNEGGVQ